MDQSDGDVSIERIIERFRDQAVAPVLSPVAALNPGAGRHPIPSDLREVRAALRAGERSWQRFPYYAWRYGERGRAFTRSDSAWTVTLAHHPQEVVDQQVRWLGALLSARGMPQWLLQLHLETLYEELVGILPERQATYERLLHAAAMLHELRRQHISDEAFAALAEGFARRVGPEWGSRLPEAGGLLVAAVADERAGIARAVPSVEAWMTDPARFPGDWIAAVRSLVQEVRAC